MASPPRPIATMNEGPLHAALKAWYAQPGDQCEVPVDGRQIDLVRGDLLIEVQTSNLFALGPKLSQLLERHPVRVVHPTVLRRWIVRTERGGKRELRRRKSPREGRLADVFGELVSLARWLANPQLSLDVVLIEEEQVRACFPGRAWRRKGWVTTERRLINVVENHFFGRPRDWLRVLPPSLPDVFTTADIAEHLCVSRDLAQKIAYCLRAAGVIHQHSKQRNARAYRVAA